MIPVRPMQSLFGLGEDEQWNHIPGNKNTVISKELKLIESIADLPRTKRPWVSWHGDAAD